jgi:hypothetical protein
VVQEGGEGDVDVGDSEIESDVRRAFGIAKEIQAAVLKNDVGGLATWRAVGGPQYPDYIYGECLKEMLAEIAVRRFACCKSCR